MVKAAALCIGLSCCLIFFVTSSLAVKPKPRTVCPTYFISLDGHCYYFSEYAVQNRDRAVKQCQAMDQRAVLVNIESIREWFKIRTYLQDNELTKYDWWTGGTNRLNANQWVWDGTNEQIYYNYWCPGEPNLPLRKNCLFLYSWPPRSGNLCWKNVECNNRDFSTYFICEVEPNK